MKLYSSAYLTFGCTVSPHLERWFDSGAVKKFNDENGTDLGHLSVGEFGDDQLYLVAFCEGSSPNEPKAMTLEGGTREDRMKWRRQILTFFQEHEITEHGEIRMWLLAGIDN